MLNVNIDLLVLFVLLSKYRKDRKRGENMSGAEIKKAITDAGLKVWQVAYAYGVTDGNFSRKLRKDFSDADTQKVLSIIEELKNA